MHAELFTPVSGKRENKASTRAAVAQEQQRRRRRRTNINVIGHVRLISLSSLHCNGEKEDMEEEEEEVKQCGSSKQRVVNISSCKNVPLPLLAQQPSRMPACPTSLTMPRSLASELEESAASAMHERSNEPLYSWVGHDPIRFTGINSSSHNVPRDHKQLQILSSGSKR